MNNRKYKAKFKNFRIILDSWRSYENVMGRLIEKLYPEKDAPIQWNTQAGNITTNLKVKIDFTLPVLREKNVVTWNCHVDNYAKGRCDIILGRYLLIELWLNLKLSEHVVESVYVPLKESRVPMVNLGACLFKYSNTRENTPK